MIASIRFSATINEEQINCESKAEGTAGTRARTKAGSKVEHEPEPHPKTEAGK